MNKYLIVLLAVFTLSPQISRAEDPVETQIEGLYQEFEQEMAPFISVYLTSGAKSMLRKQYNRLSQQYYKVCMQQFDGNILCDDFKKPFEAWFSIGDIINLCSRNPRSCINWPH